MESPESNHASVHAAFTTAGIIRNVVEYFVIVAVWFAAQWMIEHKTANAFWLTATVLTLAWIKTGFFGLENIQQLLRASKDNMAYHRFMFLMLINMSQIILSFGLDFHCLHVIDSSSFSGIRPEETQPEQMFDFVYFSTLNFTFFGYGDITPQTIAAKMLTITEIVLAFVTVIFLLSDFISLKESIRH